MSACTIAIQPCHPNRLDDEITALALQLEEIITFSDNKKGKYAADIPPDFDSAVYNDGPVIAEIAASEIQANQDRQVALDLSENDPTFEDPPASLRSAHPSAIDDWMSAVSESRHTAPYLDFPDDDDATDTEAGPSTTFAERQANVLKQLSMQFKCGVCHENHHVASVVTVPCNDRYCIECLKGLFKRATKDETLFPVRCSGRSSALSPTRTRLWN
ncbi:hypothetical protein V2W45_224556 [Cenococcum geophilum]